MLRRMSAPYILETRALTKEFKGFVAVSKVDLKVRRGSIHALMFAHAGACVIEAWQACQRL